MSSRVHPPFRLPPPNLVFPNANTLLQPPNTHTHTRTYHHYPKMNSKVQNPTRPSKNILKYTLYFNILFRIHFSHQGKQFSTYSAREYFEKLTLKNKTKQKKTKTLNGYISQARAISEWKLNVLKVHSIFFKTVLFFARSTHVGYTAGGCTPYSLRCCYQRLTEVKELNSSIAFPMIY